MKFFAAILLLFMVVGCNSDPDQPDVVVPTLGLFDVLTATPHPTSTPAPTPTSTAVPTPTLVPLEPKPFPNYLDPDLALERPTDEEILAGWKEFLTNVQWNFVAIDGSINTAHLCGNGNVYWNDVQDGRGQDWDVVFSPVVSNDDWGQIVVETRVSEFQSNTFLRLRRSDGELWGDQGQMEFSDSRQCLNLTAG